MSEGTMCLNCRKYIIDRSWGCQCGTRAIPSDDGETPNDPAAVVFGRCTVQDCAGMLIKRRVISAMFGKDRVEHFCDTCGEVNRIDIGQKCEACGGNLDPRGHLCLRGRFLPLSQEGKVEDVLPPPTVRPRTYRLLPLDYALMRSMQQCFKWRSPYTIQTSGARSW